MIRAASFAICVVPLVAGAARAQSASEPPASPAPVPDPAQPSPIQVTVGGYVHSLGGDRYERDAGDSADSFSWDVYGLSGFVRASTSPIGKSPSWWIRFS